MTWPYYEFAEFPWPAELKDIHREAITPPAAAIQQYIKLYARRFQLEQHITFLTTLTALRRPPGKQEGWLVTTKSSDGSKNSTKFDFVVLATGSFLTPRIPEIKGRDVFQGKDIFAKELTTENLGVARDLDVVVIGSGKTAWDVAGAAAEVAASVTLLGRQAHYFLPLSILNVIPYDFIGFNRLGVFLVTHPYPNSYPSIPGLTSLLHTILQPLKQLAWKFVGVILPKQYSLPAALVPVKRTAEEDLFAEIGLINDKTPFIRHLASGKIHPLIGEASYFSSTALQTKDGEKLPANLVIYATGFLRDYHYLPQEVLKALDWGEEGIPLYRDTLPPNVQGLAFVGSEVITFNAVTTYGLQSEWLAALLQGDFELPAVREQDADVARKQAWRRSFMPKHNYRAGRLAVVCQLLCDELVSDLGLQKFRKGWSFLREVWQPYSSADYAVVFKTGVKSQ